jgi:hypothetical protein
VGGLWQKQANAPTGGVTAKAKTFEMPGPTKDDDNRDLHAVTAIPLFAKDGPAYVNIKQAPNLANCPVPAILAALAYTDVGRKYLISMVTEVANVQVVTTWSNAGKLQNPPSSSTISSNRYFTVKLHGGTIEVSDVLYTNDGEQNSWEVFYLKDPKEAALWASIIEKACAVQLGSYENIDALNLTANDFWLKIVGAKPGGFAIQDDTPLSKITDAAKVAARVTTIGASKPDKIKDMVVSEFHGYAMLGMQGAKIELYDPAKPGKIAVTPQQFRHDFQAVFYKQ